MRKFVPAGAAPPDAVWRFVGNYSTESRQPDKLAILVVEVVTALTIVHAAARITLPRTAERQFQAGPRQPRIRFGYETYPDSMIVCRGRSAKRVRLGGCPGTAPGDPRPVHHTSTSRGPRRDLVQPLIQHRDVLRGDAGTGVARPQPKGQ